jgi:endonuclease/exonuclease/phosphatase family metal-dependent hydrolase
VFHGRSLPPAGRDLSAQFAAALEAWAWDVALLQEVPPWWSAYLPGTVAHSTLTSRNALLPARRWVAERRPDLLKSNGGGANMILVRALSVTERRAARLRRTPERRMVHGVRLADGTWVVNLHAQVARASRAAADIAGARAAALEWAGTAAPIVLGGDFNVGKPCVPGFARAAAHGVDFVFARGLRTAGPAEVLDRGALSDHAPVAVTLA